MKSDDPEMSRKEFSVAYNGTDRQSEHSIDVDLLAPALLAFGKLIREANKEINGKNATVNVLVVSDFEHKCFNINFEVVLTLMEQIKTLIGTQEAKDAKEILEWLGLLAGFATGTAGTLGFLGFLKWRKGRKIADVTELSDSEQSGLVTVRVEGDKNAVNVHNHTWNLANNQRALAATRDALSPVGTDGFDRIELRDGDKLIGEIPKKEADAILASCFTGIEESKDITPDIDTTSAWLTVFSPVYEEGAEKWRFKLGKEVIYADISETTIAHDALERGGALVDDTYQVRLEIETPKTPEGKPKKPTYKILEVLRFIPADPVMQGGLPHIRQEETDGDDQP
ncbi:hypothetical protein [Roseovarius pacificus]|uniref:hypothetical protein n=1 Tax=Roseovarius pacificus TaxID=337701 RepID=UPI004039838A